MRSTFIRKKSISFLHGAVFASLQWQSFYRLGELIPKDPIVRCITFCSGFLNTKLLLLVLLHGWNDPITYGGEHSTQSASPQCPGQKQLPACYYSTLVQSINTLRKHGKTHTLVDSLASRRVLLLFVYRARGHHTPGD